MAMAMAECKKQNQAQAHEQDTNKKWYIINVRTGYEQIAKASIEKRVRSEKNARRFWRSFNSIRTDCGVGKREKKNSV